MYRTRVVRRPLTETVRAPALVLGPSLTVEYRTIVVPVKRTGESEEALVAAARLAAERGATVAIVHVIEVPLSLPLDAKLPEEEETAEALLDDAQALVESYGVRAVTRLLRARKAGPAIVEEARRRDAELVAARRAAPGDRGTSRPLRRNRRLRPARIAVPRAGRRPGRRRQAGSVDERAPTQHAGSAAISALLVVLGLAVIVAHGPGRRRRRPRPRHRRAARRRRRPPPLPRDQVTMARRLPGLVRGLTEESLASVAYGEVGSSIYFALGIVALFALGLTPWVLLVAGAIFMLVSLSYAEGTAAIPETGGAAMLARRAFNDPIGFLTGWVLLLDYTIVIALAALFTPHYFGHAVGWLRLTRHPWDVVAAVFIVLAITLMRLIRRPGPLPDRDRRRRGRVRHRRDPDRARVRVPLLARPTSATARIRASRRPGTRSPSRCPVAMLAYTGLETVANLAQEAREPGKTHAAQPVRRPRAPRCSSPSLIGVVGSRRLPGRHRPDSVTTALGSDWIQAPLVGIVAAFNGHMPALLVDLLRVMVGLTGAGILLAAATTSISGVGPRRLLARPPSDAAARFRDVRPAQHAPAGGDPRRRGGLDHARDRLRLASAARPGSSPACTASAS